MINQLTWIESNNDLITDRLMIWSTDRLIRLIDRINVAGAENVAAGEQIEFAKLDDKVKAFTEGAAAEGGVDSVKRRTEIEAGLFQKGAVKERMSRQLAYRLINFEIN